MPHSYKTRGGGTIVILIFPRRKMMLTDLAKVTQWIVDKPKIWIKLRTPEPKFPHAASKGTKNMQDKLVWLHSGDTVAPINLKMFRKSFFDNLSDKKSSDSLGRSLASVFSILKLKIKWDVVKNEGALLMKFFISPSPHCLLSTACHSCKERGLC